MKTATIASLIIASLVLPLAAQEEGEKAPGKGKGNPEKMFTKLDTNTDGFLSKEEFMKSPAATKNEAKAEANFKKKDKNSDDKLSKEEFTAKPEGKGKKKESEEAGE